jgi:hypothetical protein
LLLYSSTSEIAIYSKLTRAARKSLSTARRLELESPSSFGELVMKNTYGGGSCSKRNRLRYSANPAGDYSWPTRSEHKRQNNVAGEDDILAIAYAEVASVGYLYAIPNWTKPIVTSTVSDQRSSLNQSQFRTITLRWIHRVCSDLNTARSMLLRNQSSVVPARAGSILDVP